MLPWIRQVLVALFFALPLSPVALSAEAAGQGTEPELTEAFGFRFGALDGWTIEHGEKNGLLTWTLRPDHGLHDVGGLLSVTLTAMKPTPGQDVEAAFRRFARSYAERYLSGRVVRVESSRFGALPAFRAHLSGHLDGSGQAVDVVLLLFLAEHDEVILSAVARTDAKAALEDIGRPGSLVEPAEPGVDEQAEAQGGAVSSPTLSDPADDDSLEPVEPGIDGVATDQNGAEETPEETANDTAPIEAKPEAGDVRFTLVPDTKGRFRPFAWGGGDPATTVINDDTGMTIAIPAEMRAGGIGLTTAADAVPVGDLAAGAETRLDLAFDPDATDHAEIILCPGDMAPCLSEPGLHILIDRTGTGAQMTIVRLDGNHRVEPLPGGMPKALAIVIAQDGIDLMPSSGAALRIDRPSGIRAHAALALLVSARQTADGATLMLTSAAVTITAPGYLPLPAAVLSESRLFPETDPATWRHHAESGGDFDAFARLDDAGLLVEVPENRSWGVTGLTSAEPLLTVPDEPDPAIWKTLHLQVNPDRSPAFAVALVREVESPIWNGSVAYLSVGRKDGAIAATLYVCASAARSVSIPVARNWSGALTLSLRSDALTVTIGDQTRTLLSTCQTPGDRLHLAIAATPLVENQPSGLLLSTITMRRSADALDAAEFDGSEVDDSAFDPSLWVSALAKELANDRAD